jgi:hypothetical protein
MATVRVRIVILTVWITLSVCPFNPMAHTANTWTGMSSRHGGLIERMYSEYNRSSQY